MRGQDGEIVAHTGPGIGITSGEIEALARVGPADLVHPLFRNMIYIRAIHHQIGRTYLVVVELLVGVALSARPDLE